MTTTAVIPALLDAFDVLLPGILVTTELPADHGADDFECVRLVAAGGPELADEVIDWADVAWEAWAAGDSGARAEALAGRVRDAFYAMSGPYGGGYVVEATSTRGRDFPDAVTQIPRQVGQARVLFHAIS